MPKTKNPDLALGNPIKFYKDTVTLRFSERDHIYYLVRDDGELEPLSGVTRICGIIDKSNYLIPWAAKVTIEKLLRTVPQQNDDSGSFIALEWPVFEEIALAAKSAHREKLVDAGDVGSAAHLWIEDSIRWAIAFNKGRVEKLVDKRPEDERAVNCGNAALDWMKKHQVVWLKTEHKIYSRKWKYAGTMDGKALVTACDSPTCCGRFSMFANQLAICDWKSSNQLRTDYVLQTAAYQQAEQEEYGEKIEARWILRLGKEDGKFESWYCTNFEEDFEAFKLCLLLTRQLDTIEKRISEMKKERTKIKRQTKKTND